MRGVGLLIAALMGAGCSFDSGGTSASDDAGMGQPDAAADASVVQCTRDEECATPPSLCHLSGLCNPSTQRCEFPQKDCSAAGDQCNTGICEDSSGACVPSPSFDGEDCNGGTTCEDFSSCGGFDSGDICDETGTRSRDCTDRTCSSGACIDLPRLDTEACSRDQDGVECASEACGAFSACGGFAGTCDESGSKSRDCTSFACSSASCVGTNFVDTNGCVRGSRDGITCAPDDCTSFGACMGFADTCDESGTRERTCTPNACMSESCDPGPPFVDSMACSRVTDTLKCGETCATVCMGTGDCATVCMGACVTECTDVLCSGGICGG